MTLDQAQEKRKDGYWIVTNKKLTIVILVTKDEKVAREECLKHPGKFNLPSRRLFTPLVKAKPEIYDDRLANPGAWFHGK